MPKRQLRKSGEWITLGETDYVVEAVEGYGGSCIVYRASYEDKLNQGFFHQVLIKELFPCLPNGLIYRDASGNICCRGEGEEYMEHCRQSFYLGNKANLELLDRMPEQVSGNLNSYVAYGTYYSVLPVHGGKTLEQILEDGIAYRNLKETAKLILKILDALECFHRNQILHLDISPDNLLILSDRVLLIDYNSVWSVEKMGGDEFFFHEKAGYSAPEIRLREMESVSYASDLYSVCAVMFRMLTGRLLSDQEVVGNNLRRCFPKDLGIFRDQPATAATKVVQIVFKGLHLLARRRYQTIGELRLDINELILRIDGRGISHSSIWEGSRRCFKQAKRTEEVCFPCRVMAADGKVLLKSDLLDRLKEGGQLLLKGPGGMGKTCFLMDLWRQGIRQYDVHRPIMIYIPLADYQAGKEDTSYIRRYILNNLCYFHPTEGMEEALHELDQMFGREYGGEVCFLLLLDGLNEAGSRRSGLIREIEDLAGRAGVGILVTDRSDSVKQYGMYSFQTVQMLGLSPEEAKQLLEQKQIALPQQRELLNLLCNPMMLSLYEKIMAMEREDRDSCESRPAMENIDDMVGAYLESLCTRQMRLNSGNQTEQLRHSYLFKHLYPCIAGEMKRRDKILLTFEELFCLVRKNYLDLQKKSFTMAFPEYMGKSRLMLKDIANEREWFDYAVAEQLTEHWNLLEKSEGGNYRLVHHDFIGYLDRQYKKNKNIIFRYRWKENGTKVLLVSLLLAVAMAGAAKGLRDYLPVTATPEERQAARTIMERLIFNFQILDIQLNSQRFVLEEASKPDVLEGKTDSVNNLSALIHKQRQNMSQYSLMASDKGPWLDEWKDSQFNLPLTEIRTLCGRPGEVDIFMSDAMEHLEQGLCMEDSVYLEMEQRKALVDVYQEYLDAYARVCYLELTYILSQMDQEETEQILDSVEKMEIFSSYLLVYPLSGQTEEVEKRKLSAAQKQLQTAKDEMKMENYKISLPDW